MVRSENDDTRIEYFAPTTPHTEQRGEALDRVVHDEHLGEDGESIHADHTTESGAGPRIRNRALLFAAGGGVFGAVLGIILIIAPGPIQTDTTAGSIGYVAIQALVFAVVVGLVTTLLLMEREDGRTVRNAEEATRSSNRRSARVRARGES